ncbi:hypothetical protein SAMN05216357_11930 [Porphyromonadaceae bacterium KH3CP3RA]|nr:hypothetical protein SAMN05216357_11930 [Porphyromonadaceae bacterium KH3CP3RA]
MKNIYIKIFTFLLMLAMIACTKDDENIQKGNTFSIKVEHNIDLPYVITSKDEIIFDVTISSNSDNKIKEAILSLDGKLLHTATVSSSGDIALQYTYKATGDNVGKSLIFILTVMDEDGNTVDKDFTVYVESAPANIDIVLPVDAPSEIKDNESVDFDIMVSSENDLKYIKTLLNGNEITELTKETFENPKEDTYHFVYQPTVADAEKTLTFMIEVMDVLGNLVKQNYTLDVIRAQEADFNFYQRVILGGQNSANYEPYFGTTTGEVYPKIGAAEKSANIDLISFFSGGTNRRFQIASPTAQNVADFVYTVVLYGEDALNNWPVRNETLFKRLTITPSDFDLIVSAAEMEALYTDSDAPAELTSGNLEDGNVIAFKTAAGKYGVFHMITRSGDANIGNLTVDIKVQK